MRRAGLCACAALALAAPLFAQSDDGMQRIARELTPAVERAVGLVFKRPPRVAERSREQFRRYLERKVAREVPAAEQRAEDRAFKVLRLLPDTLDLLKLQLEMLQQQVLGFYDPDSSTLFVIRGADPLMVRAVAAHELVHALQDQYMRLAPILRMRRQNDRQSAAQAVFEGQATVAGLMAVQPGLTVDQVAQVFALSRGHLDDPQGADLPGMAEFRNAPLILREHLLFPYLDGAQFIVAFEQRRTNDTEQPYGARLPVSTEQILHPPKYTAGERPRRVSIVAAPGDTVIYSDDFGEADTRSVLRTWGAAADDAVAAAAGWNGDRFAVLGTRSGTAVVWAVAWDTPEDATQFERAMRSGWSHVAGAADGAARRWRIDVLEIGGVKVVRLMDAPAAWTGWAHVPVVRVVR